MTNVAHLPARAVLAVTGPDRVDYLQGLVSNDVALAVPDHAVWAALLTPQGKWLADFFIHAEPERLLLDIEGAQAEMLAQRLTRFRLRARVAIEPTLLQVFAGWDTPAPPEAVPDPRLPAAGWRLLAASPVSATSSAADYDTHRLRLGLPDGSRDMEAEKTTLLEAGFDELHGVSWTKGCYMGQELTARTKYRGLLKRRLILVTAIPAVPPPGTPILADGTDVGTMRSGQGTRGLAILRLDALGRTLTAAGTDLAPAIPPWIALNPIVEPV